MTKEEALLKLNENQARLNEIETERSIIGRANKELKNQYFTDTFGINIGDIVEIPKKKYSIFLTNVILDSILRVDKMCGKRVLKNGELGQEVLIYSWDLPDQFKA